MQIINNIHVYLYIFILKYIKINSDLGWKLCGTAVSTDKITLPTQFNELYIDAWASVNGIIYNSIGTIIKNAINGCATEIFYLSGGYTTGDSRNARIYTDGIYLWLCEFKQDNTNYIESATMNVYYR